MPDENRFAGLSDADEDPPEPTEEPEPAEDAASSADGAEEGGPAFEFDETTAKSIYARSETLELLEDTEFEVEMLLRREHGVRDPTGREFHDAAVRVLADHADEIVERILQTRAGDDQDE